MEEFSPENVSTWCRVCLSEAEGELIPLDFKVQDVSTVGDLITSCSGVVVSVEDSLPNNCCERCIERLISAYNLAKQCRESDAVLRTVCREKEEDVPIVDDNVSSESGSDLETAATDHSEVDDREEDATSVHEVEPEVLTICCACRTDFETVEAFEEHITTVHVPERSSDASKKPYQCEICFKRYFKKTSLNRHKRLAASGSKVRAVKEEEPAVIRCCGCRKDFDTADELKEHSRSEHADTRVVVDESRPFECEICFKRYSNKASLSRHLRERFAEKRTRMVRKLAQNQCCGCRQKFPSREQLGQHSKQIHEPDRRDDLDGIKTFECGTCFSRYTTREALTRHRTYIHMDQLYKCQQCDKTFVKRIMLRFHERKFHNGVQQEVIGPYQCSRCGKTFMQPSSLTNHEKVHDQSERFECSICRKTFLSKGNLQAHLKLHQNPAREREPQYECPVCRCRFKTPNYLEVHARVHTGEKPYQCKLCSKQFAHASGYKRHLLTHSSLKPFVCRFCQRGFSNRPNMLIHEKSHGTERNAKCDICDKEFVHERYLKKHRKRHLC